MSLPLRRLCRALLSSASTVLALLAGLVVVSLSATPAGAAATAVVTDCSNAGTLGAIDDTPSVQVNLGFSMNFFGTTRSSMWVNNNGNVTFGEAMSAYTPFTIGADTPPILAVFFGDVDTEGAGSGQTRWGTTTYEGRPAFCVNWRDVGYFEARTDKTNDFQLLIVDRSDVAPGDVDLVYNYNRISWETGSHNTSGGTNGLGGTSAGVGFSNGDGNAAHFYDKPGSRQPGSFLDTNATTGLTNTSTNSAVRGRHVFNLRGGQVAGITTAPDTRIDAPAGQYVTSRTPTLRYSAAPAASGTTFACRIAAGTAAGGTFASCPSAGYTPSSPLTEGSAYTFEVRATSPTGQTDASPASRTFTVDSTAPDTEITTGRSGRGPARYTRFTFAGLGADSGTTTFRCAITRGANTPSFNACTSPTDVSGMADDSYTFSVAAVDAAGNVDPTPATNSFVVDNSAPTMTVASGPQGPVRTADVAFTWSAANPADLSSVECRLDGPGDTVGTWGACPSGGAYDDLADGAYTFSVRGTNGAGNQGQAATRSFTVDTVAPGGLTVTEGPDGLVRSSSARFAWSGVESGATSECRLVEAGADAAWSPCGQPLTYTGLGEGSHTFEVRAVDAAGNTGAAASRSFTVDTVGPDALEILSGPKGPTDEADAGFTWSEPAADVTEVRTALVGPDGPVAGGVTDGDSVSWSGLPDGGYTLTVTAYDAAGNSTATTRTFTVDTVAPDAPTITDGPASQTAETSPTVRWTVPSDVARVECRLDGPGDTEGEWGTCAEGSAAYSALADGAYAARVRSYDAAGNVSEVAARSFTVDTDGPAAPTITGGPEAHVASGDVEVTWTSAPDAVRDECRIRNAQSELSDWTTCANGRVVHTGLVDGTWTIEVRSVDAAGNTGAVAERVFAVDSVAPAPVQLTGGPEGPTGSADATFTWGEPEEGATVQCRLDGPGSVVGTWGTCSSGRSYSDLEDGTYTFAVRTVDAAGNTSETPERTFTVDTTAPDAAAVTDGPEGDVASGDADFAWTAPDDAATVECRLDGPAGTEGAWVACADGDTSYDDLADGDYVFGVRVTDAAGNEAPVSTRSFTVDTVAPDAVVLTSAPEGLVAVGDAAFAWTAPEDAAVVECRLDGPDEGEGEWTACADGDTSYDDLADGAHTFSVRVRDAAGNASEPTSWSFTVDTTAPDAEIVGGTTGTVQGSSVQFTYGTEDTAEGTTFECRLLRSGDEPGEFVPCAAEGASYAELPDGDYTFEVRAVDIAGNAGAAVSNAFRVNVGRPTITAQLRSRAPISATGWYTTPVTVSYTCEANGSPMVGACPSPTRYPLANTDRGVVRSIRTADGDVAQVRTVLNIDPWKPWVTAGGFTPGRPVSSLPRVRCVGTDNRSGIASCTSRVRRSPDGRKVVVTLRATDVAGNQRTRVLRAPYVG